MKATPQPEALFDELYDSYHKALHSYFLARTGSDDAAADMLQELFMRVWRNMAAVASMDADGRRWWLYAVAKNLTTDWYRKSRTAPVPSGSRPDEPSGGGEGPSEVYERKEAMAELNARIWALPEELRIILVMTVVGGANSAQVAEVVGKPPGTVRYLLHKARRILAKGSGYGG